MLSKEFFDEYGKKRLRELLEKGEKDVTIYAGFHDVFGDAGIVACNKCGTPCFVRPWLLEAIIEHKWKVICICCADPKLFKGQVVMDFSKIETEIEAENMSWVCEECGKVNKILKKQCLYCGAMKEKAKP